MAITQKSRWDDVGSEPPAGEAKYTAGEQPIAEYDNWFNKSVADDISSLNKELAGRTLNKGNGSYETVTETSLTLKQSVTPNNDFISLIDSIHVVANNLSGSGCTLYFMLRALLSDGTTEVDLLDSEETVAEGESFDDVLIDVMSKIPTNEKIKAVRLYARCSITPSAGNEPTVQLEKVTGVQN
ncbi:hypothetical protein DRO97_10220 [Archaeoglobales archaeon]|nr:MAG: hypothetical protein DRO97_10220 [Archaeoglobales archaeon]